MRLHQQLHRIVRWLHYNLTFSQQSLPSLFLTKRPLCPFRLRHVHLHRQPKTALRTTSFRQESRPSLFLETCLVSVPQSETCAPAPTTQNGALVTIQPVADNSVVRRTLADRAEKQLREERWMAGSRHSERHFVNKNGHRIYTQQWLPDGTPMK